jgi:hypothetical protein
VTGNSAASCAACEASCASACAAPWPGGSGSLPRAVRVPRLIQMNAPTVPTRPMTTARRATLLSMVSP